MVSARLRLPAAVGRDALRAYVDNVLRMVELDDGEALPLCAPSSLRPIFSPEVFSQTANATIRTS